MAKIIKSMVIQLQLSKDIAGEICIDATAHVNIGASEYPEFNMSRGIPLTLTDAQEKAVKKFAKEKLQDIMVDNNAEDAIYVPPEV